MEHPCVKCGACCANWRVQFYWRETEQGGNYRVPVQLTEDMDVFHKCMKGTNVKRGNRCVALEGRIGGKVSCSIYSDRPAPCRKFRASYEDGTQHKRCDEARRAHGMRPLRPEDWTTPPVLSGNRHVDERA